MSWMKIFKSLWIQQANAWIVVASFVYLAINKGFNLMLSQPLLFIIFIALGLISSSLIFSIHAYLLSKKSFKAVSEQSIKLSAQSEILLAHKRQIDFIIDTLKDIHAHFWFLKGDINRSMAYTFRESPYTSFVLWLRSAESFYRSGDIDMTRTSLKETYDAIKRVESVTMEDLNESNNLLTNIETANFKHEINAINNEIERLTKNTI